MNQPSPQEAGATTDAPGHRPAATTHRLAAIVDSSSDRIISKDLAGVIQTWNRAAEQIFGYTEKEMIGSPMLRLFPPDLLDEESQILARLGRDERIAPFDTVRIRRDGVPVHIFVTMSPIHDSAGKVIGASQIVRDVTEKREMERELRESEGNFRQLASSLPQLVWTCDAMGQCDFLSRQWLDYTGLPEAGQLGFDWLEQVHADDRAPTAAVWQAAQDAGSDFLIEFRLRRHDGIYRLFDTRAVRLRDAQGRTVKWFGTCTDITQRKEAETSLLERERRLMELASDLEQKVIERSAKLRESDERYRQIFDTAREGFWVIDQNSRTLLANPRMGQILGWDAGELLGTSLFDHMCEQGRIQALANIERRKQGEAEDHEFVFRRKDGSDVWTSLVTSPLTDANGLYQGALALVTDITERKGAERQLRDSLVEKEILLREIHHRVKNNLQIISSLLHFQALKSTSDGERQNFSDAQHRLRSMILVHEMLYRSKSLSKIDLGGYVRALAEQVHAAYRTEGRRADLQIDVGTVSVPVETALPCGMLLTELLTNAYKYAFADGRTGALRIELRPLAAHFRLVVQDTGPGLPAGVDPQGAETFGMQLITNLAEQLHATLSYTRTSPDAGGLRVEVTAPLLNVQDAAAVAAPGFTPQSAKAGQ